MTLAEALEALGVDADADAVGIRRAYLKLVRVHAPERDATRFMRIREAFELATAHAAQLRVGASRQELPPPRTAPNQQQLVALALDPQPERRERLAHALLEAGAGIEVYETWLSTLAWDEWPAVLRAGMARGFGKLEHVLRVEFSHLLTQQELEAWEQAVERGETSDGLWLALCQLARGVDPARVAALTQRVIAALSQHGELSQHDEETSVSIALELLLADRSQLAEQLLQALAEAQLDLETRAPSLRVRAACELVEIHRHLDARVVAVLAKSIATNGSAQAELQLAEFVIQHRVAWFASMRLLQDHCPALVTLYAPPESWRERRFQGWSFAVWAVLAALISFVPVGAYRAWRSARSERVALECAADASQFCKAIAEWNSVSECDDSSQAVGWVQREYERILLRRLPSQREADALQAVVRATHSLCYPAPKAAP